MTQYNTLDVRLSNSKIIKLKSGIKNDAEVTLKVSSNVVGDSNNENKLLTKTPVSRLRKAFANNCLECT